MARTPKDECPFCGCHPYEYVDNGVGSVPVAVTCCEFGVAYFQDTATVTLSWDQFHEIAELLRAMRKLGMNPQLPE